jgi:hypothetical protein
VNLSTDILLGTFINIFLLQKFNQLFQHLEERHNFGRIELNSGNYGRHYDIIIIIFRVRVQFNGEDENCIGSWLLAVGSLILYYIYILPYRKFFKETAMVKLANTIFYLGINIDYKQGNHYLVNVCTSR